MELVIDRCATVTPAWDRRGAALRGGATELKPGAMGGAGHLQSEMQVRFETGNLRGGAADHDLPTSILFHQTDILDGRLGAIARTHDDAHLELARHVQVLQAPLQLGRVLCDDQSRSRKHGKFSGLNDASSGAGTSWRSLRRVAITPA